MVVLGGEGGLFLMSEVILCMHEIPLSEPRAAWLPEPPSTTGTGVPRSQETVILKTPTMFLNCIYS